MNNNESDFDKKKKETPFFSPRLREDCNQTLGYNCGFGGKANRWFGFHPNIVNINVCVV